MTQYGIIINNLLFRIKIKKCSVHSAYYQTNSTKHIEVNILLLKQKTSEQKLSY